MLQGKKNLTEELLNAGISEESFFSRENKYIFRAIKEEFDCGVIDPDGIQEKFIIKGLIGANDNKNRIMHIADWLEVKTTYKHSQQVKETIKVLSDYEVVRKAIEMCENQIKMIESGAIKPQRLIDTAKKFVETASEKANTEIKVYDAKKAVKAFEGALIENAEQSQGQALMTGLPQIDTIGDGFRKGEMVVIAAPPSEGKSILALQVAGEGLRQDKPMMIFTLEMTTEVVMCRLCSYLKRIPLSHIVSPKRATKEELIRIKEWMHKLSTHDNLFIVDEASMTMDTITARALEQHKKTPLGGIIIDYAGLVSPPKGSTKSREQEVAYISSQTKQLAKACSCTTILLSQLNDDGKLRESRSLGMDADIYFKIIPEKGIAVMKYRSAKKGYILPLVMDGEFQRFKPKDT